MDALAREDVGRVRVLRLNRPPSNTLTLELLAGLAREAAEAAADPAVRCLVLASALPKYFSAGLDLDEMFSLPEARRADLFDRMVGAHRALAACGKPTVAAIEGYALLGGFILTLGCDWRFACRETARVALSEVRLGLSPTAPLVRLVAGLSGRPGLIKELVLRGATLRAEEAFEAGLADRLLPAEGFMDEVLREAQRLSQSAPAAYASIARELRRASLPDEDSLWRQAMADFAAVFAGPEGREGLAAAKEKRKPRWD